MMQRIKDERLKIKNLQNIRTAYIIQSIGIIAILAYDLITKGINEMTRNPVWIIFILSATVSAFLSMNISVDHEESETSPKKGLYISICVLTIISIFMGYLNTLDEDFTIVNGFILGGIVFVCGLIPILFAFHLRNKNKD